MPGCWAGPPLSAAPLLLGLGRGLSCSDFFPVQSLLIMKKMALDVCNHTIFNKLLQIALSGSVALAMRTNLSFNGI